MRDGRTLIGILRSVDQFANLILHQAVERIHVGSNFGDIPRGVFLVRGDNITIIGEIVSHKKIIKLRVLHNSYVIHKYCNLQDKEKEDNSPLHSVSVETILAAQREEQEERKIKDARRIKAFKERGIIIPETGIPHDD